MVGKIKNTLSLENMKIMAPIGLLISLGFFIWYASSSYSNINTKIQDHDSKIEALEMGYQQTNETLNDIVATLARLDERTLAIVDSLKKK